MGGRILVNSREPEECRVAIVKGGRLEDLFVEGALGPKEVGHVYKGRVVHVEPAIQAAFVDIGAGKTGFLHVSDLLPAYARRPGVMPVQDLSRQASSRGKIRIQDALVPGQDVLVQITKGMVGRKGPGLSSYISLPGRYLVLMPGISRHGVSKRIEDGEERARLRQKLEDLHPGEDVGFIVRTAGADRPKKDLERDLGYLIRLWDDILRRAVQEKAPAMLYQEGDLLVRVIRDLVDPGTEQIVIDTEPVYRRAKEFLREVMPDQEKLARLYTGSTPIFHRFGIEEEIRRIYNHEVPLPSGGSLVIEETEALVGIDVNSGKCRSERDLESTALRTNLEAVDEIVRQLRLRDLGGVVVVDFIDMEVEANRRQVERALRARLRGERAKTWLTRISRFGLIEMTRQRVGLSLERASFIPCRSCGGRGRVRPVESVGREALRELRAVMGSRRRRTVELTGGPPVIEYLSREKKKEIAKLEKRYGRKVALRTDPGLRVDEYRISCP